MSEPIIPVKSGGEIERWWRQVVAVAAVDEAVNVDVAEADVPAAGEAVGLDVSRLADIDRAGTGMFTMHPGGIGPAMTDDVNAFVIAPAEGTLCNVVSAEDLTEAHIGTLNSSYLCVGRAPDDQIARAQLWRTTLVERTMTQFGEHASRNGPSACPAVIWVTEPESVEDCLCFWNLRALRPLRFATVPMLMLPVDQVQHWLGFSDQLAYMLARPAQFAPDVVMRSISAAESKLHETAGHLKLQHTTDEVRSGMHSPAPNRHPPFTYRTDVEPRIWFAFERTYGQNTQVDAHLFMDTTTHPAHLSGELHHRRHGANPNLGTATRSTSAPPGHRFGCRGQCRLERRGMSGLTPEYARRAPSRLFLSAHYCAGRAGRPAVWERGTGPAGSPDRGPANRSANVSAKLAN